MQEFENGLVAAPMSPAIRDRIRKELEKDSKEPTKEQSDYENVIPINRGDE
jgi:hypothetical protein